MARIAAIQMVSEPDVAPNLAAAARLVAQAAGEGARLVALPEFFCILGRHESDKVKVRERDGAGPIQDFLAQAAQRNRVWMIGGTVPLECGDPARVRSACLVYDDSGRRIARYDKMHLFAYRTGTESYDESRTIEPGSEPRAISDCRKLEMMSEMFGILIQGIRSGFAKGDYNVRLGWLRSMRG